MGLGLAVHGRRRPTAADAAIDRVVRGDVPGPVRAGLLHLSDAPLVVALVVVAAALALRAGRLRAAALLVLVVPVALAVTESAKRVVDRSEVVTSGGVAHRVLGYPSGHETLAAAWAAAVAVAVVASTRRRGAQVLATVAALLYCLAAGVGLVGEGYHDPVDIAGAVAVAALVATGGAIVLRVGPAVGTS